MRITGVYSPKLLLKAQAPFLRLLTALVEQFTFVDLKDNATAIEALTRVASYLRELAHSAAATDSLVGVGVIKNLIDAATSIEQATKTAGKGLSDAVALMDRAALGVARSVSDYYLASDSQVLGAGKTVSDLLASRDYPALTPHPYLSEALDAPVDGVPVLSAALVWQESGQYVEGYGDYADETYFLKTPQAIETQFLLSAGKSFSETTSLLEALAKSFDRPVADATSGVTDVPTLSPGVGKSEFVACVEALTRAAVKTLADSAAGSETFRFSSAKTLAADTAASTDAFSKVALQSRTFSDTSNFSDSRIASVAKPFSDSFSASDAPAKTFYISFLEGGEYAVSGYFEAADYVVGGIAVGDSLTHVP